MQETPRAKRRRFRRFARYLNGLEKTMEQGDNLDLARWMRTHKTPGEKEVWRTLKRLNRQATEIHGRGVKRPKWRCQTPMLGFIADFYCPFYKLVLEVDGSSHREAERVTKDARKDAAFAKKGIRVVRMPWPFRMKAREAIHWIIEARKAELRGDELVSLIPEDQEEHLSSMRDELREARSS